MKPQSGVGGQELGVSSQQLASTGGYTLVNSWWSALSGRWSSPLILLVYSLLTLILTHPLLFNLTTAVPNDIGDPLLNTWILAWDSHALLTDPLNLFNANIFYPLPNTLAYSEHLLSTALLALPLQLISAEPIAAYNMSLLATFPLAAFGMYLLALRWTGQRSAAFIAGLIFAFSPYRFAAIAHLHLLTFQWLPFALLCLDMSLKRGPGARGQRPVCARPLTPNLWPLALLVFLLLQLLASWYLALYTLFILGIYLLATLLSQQLARFNLAQLSLSFLISIGLILPFVWPYFALLDDLRAARPLSLALSLAATPTDFAAAAPFNRLFGPFTEPLRTRSNFTEENTLFLGFVAPILALVSLRIFRPFRFLLYALRLRAEPPRGTLYALLLLILLSFTLTFPAPYAILAHFFPLSTIVRVPPRWIIPALFALAGLAAFGYSVITHQCEASSWGALVRSLPVGRISAKPPRGTYQSQASSANTTAYLKPTLFLLICAFLLVEAYSVPLPLASVENRTSLKPAYHWLAEQPGPIAVVELPLHSAPAPEFPEVKRLYASTLGWWKLVNGYSGYTPSRQPELAEALASFPDPDSITALQNLATSSPSRPLRVAPSPLSTLSLFLLVHPGEAPFDRAHWETTARWQAERNPSLFPLGPFEGDYLYQIIPLNPARFTTPIATFGPNQIRLLAYSLSTPDLQLTKPNSFSDSMRPASRLSTSGSRLILYWQSTTSISINATVFIHFRAPDGFVRSQADGPPVSGHYPTTAWQPNEIIQDIHFLPPTTNLTQVDHLAIGLYEPSTEERLPAFAPNAQRLAEDALLIPLH